MTEKTDRHDLGVPRPEHPRPQFVRDEWLCLNGWWGFEVDAGDSGLERGLAERELTGEILVPFCPEAPRSGLEETDRMAAVWYRRSFTVPSDWSGRRVLLHLQAVDHEATVWVNGKVVGRHRGGFTPTTCDITDVALPGATSAIVVRARDPWWEPQARGKQAAAVHPNDAGRGAPMTRTFTASSSNSSTVREAP